ncbi:DUF4352 domain-containing protein [Streptomyces flaveus]|uniref:DUF4352 domain-containing protein n=1 Tax=Streptomyces flaveus TaxID=66370 RepID=A0A917VE79_9ACTN|nr:DUF4352 domain-containing protein [Streptomyces flaveus]GGK65549.1 hypothetical protein GCM10010094_28240 [Streptomyces flaveus]
MTDTTPPPMPGFPPPEPAPKKSRTNAIIIGAAAAVIAAVVATGVVVANSRDDDGSDAATTSETSAPTDDTITAAEEPEPTPENTEPEILGLTDGVSYENDVEVALSGYTRGVSTEYGSPENTAYVSFTVKIVNGSEATMNLAAAYFQCQYGDQATAGEEVYDEDRGLEGMPTTHLRPGRTMTAKVACALPKGEEYLQIELAPDFESETAIFAGNVK